MVQQTQLAWTAHPDIDAWMEASRVNPARGIREAMADPRMKPALNRLFTDLEPAMTNLGRFLGRGSW